MALLEGDYQRRIAVISVSGQPIPAPCTVQNTAHCVATNNFEAKFEVHSLLLQKHMRQSSAVSWDDQSLQSAARSVATNNFATLLNLKYSCILNLQKHLRQSSIHCNVLGQAIPGLCTDVCCALPRTNIVRYCS